VDAFTVIAWPARARDRRCAMPMPKDVGIIDLMLGIPSRDPTPQYAFMKPLFRDPESLQSFEFPVEYMFKDVPKFERRDDAIKYTLEQLDRFGIEKALIGVSETPPIDECLLSTGYPY
jgi:hypothetical protein